MIRPTKKTIVPFASRILDALLPRHCVLCGQASTGSNLCVPCAAELPRPDHTCRMCGLPLTSVHDWICGVCLHKPPAWDRSVAALPYRFPVDQLVLRFKFSRSLACGEVLGRELLAAVLSSEEPLPDFIIPVPLHKTRLFLRSFNQADLLAGMVGKQLGIPVVRSVLRRTRHTQAQSGLDAAGRKKNIRDAFSCRSPAGLTQALHIGLVDDVCTTGETLAACTRTLKAAGAERVTVWVAARAPPP